MRAREGINMMIAASPTTRPIRKRREPPDTSRTARVDLPLTQMLLRRCLRHLVSHRTARIRQPDGVPVKRGKPSLRHDRLQIEPIVKADTTGKHVKAFSGESRFDFRRRCQYRAQIIVCCVPVHVYVLPVDMPPRPALLLYYANAAR